MLAAGEQVAAFGRSSVRGAAGGVAVSLAQPRCLALRVWRPGPGDGEFSHRYCAAVLNAVHYVGACPVVVDVDPATGNLDPAAAAAPDVKRARSSCPHLNGLPADLDRLAALEVPLIEDCAQAAGATYRGQRVGSYGAVAIFSFYATKVITTGQGGMLVSTNQDLLARARDLVEYDNRDDYQVRHNYRLTDLQAAIGRQQLQRLPGFVARRRALAERFRQEGCADWHGPRDGHLYYRYLLRVRDVEAAARWFREQGIDAKRPVYRPLHHYLSGVDCPAADAIHETILSVPLYPALSAMEVDHIVGTLARWAATC